MTENHPTHNAPAQTPEDPGFLERVIHNQNVMNDATASEGQSEQPTHARPESHDDFTPVPELDPINTTVSGLGKFIAKVRLANIERQVRKTDGQLYYKRRDEARDGKKNQHELPVFQVWRNESRMAKKGRRGGRKIGLTTNYGAMDGGRLMRDRTTVPDETTYFSANQKLRRIESAIDRSVTHANTLEARQAALIARRDDLRYQLGRTEATSTPRELTPAAEEPITISGQYALALEQAKEGGALNKDELIERLKEIAEANPRRFPSLLRKWNRENRLREGSHDALIDPGEEFRKSLPSIIPKLVGRVWEKLIEEGVVDESGQILKSPQEIEQVKERLDYRPVTTNGPGTARRAEVMAARQSLKPLDLLEKAGISADDIAQMHDVIADKIRREVKRRTGGLGQKLTDEEFAELVDGMREKVIRAVFDKNADEAVIIATKKAVAAHHNKGKVRLRRGR